MATGMTRGEGRAARGERSGNPPLTGPIRSYKDLIAWQKGMRLARLVYDATASFPTDERFGLTSQMRRAAISVPSNVAEGHARKSRAEFVQFVSHAEGSLAELETQVLLADDLCFFEKDAGRALLQQIDELQRILNGLRQRLSRPSPLPSRP